MNSVIIVAGGRGLRMGKDIPKQFLILKSEPILMHTIRAFYNWDNDCEIVLVLPANQQPYWEKLVVEYEFDIPIKIAIGGETRFHSVKNGLAEATGETIGIHDGVRPLVCEKTIKICFTVAQKQGNAIPCIPVNDSLRIVEKKVSRNLFNKRIIMLEDRLFYDNSINDINVVWYYLQK